MKSAEEIRKLRRMKGYYSQQSVVEEFEKHGVVIKRQTYHLKEHGKIPFSAKEIKILVEILGITAEEGLDFFS